MEKIFCPDKLDIDPNSLNAEKEFLHWRRTFDNFILECGERAPDKFRCLIKYVSASVFDYFADETTFDSAIAALEKLYVKKKKCYIFSI